MENFNTYPTPNTNDEASAQYGPDNEAPTQYSTPEKFGPTSDYYGYGTNELGQDNTKDDAEGEYIENTINDRVDNLYAQNEAQLAAEDEAMWADKDAEDLAKKEALAKEKLQEQINLAVDEYISEITSLQKAQMPSNPQKPQVPETLPTPTTMETPTETPEESSAETSAENLSTSIEDLDMPVANPLNPLGQNTPQQTTTPEYRTMDSTQLGVTEPNTTQNDINSINDNIPQNTAQNVVNPITPNNVSSPIQN